MVLNVEEMCLDIEDDLQASSFVLVVDSHFDAGVVFGLLQRLG